MGHFLSAVCHRRAAQRRIPVHPRVMTVRAIRLQMSLFRCTTMHEVAALDGLPCRRSRVSNPFIRSIEAPLRRGFLAWGLIDTMSVIRQLNAGHDGPSG